MTPEQRHALYTALLSAFTSVSDLDKVVTFAFGKSLDQLAGAGDLEDRLFAVIDWADTHGQVDQLISTACSERPDRTDLAALAREWQASTTKPARPVQGRDPVRADDRDTPTRTGRRRFVSTPEELMQLMNFAAAWMFCALSMLVVLYLVSADRAPWWAVLAVLALVLPVGLMFSRGAMRRTGSMG